MNSSSSTAIPTSAASSYLFKLCKHFAKKIPATWRDDHLAGTATFEWGSAVFEADDARLQIHCTADNDAALERLESVIAQHVDLLTRKEPIVISWQRQVRAPA